MACHMAAAVHIKTKDRSIISHLQGMGIQIERDVHLWSNKTYLSKPLLLKEDRLIAAHRRWFSQFYSENSPRLDFKKENDLSW